MRFVGRSNNQRKLRDSGSRRGSFRGRGRPRLNLGEMAQGNPLNAMIKEAVDHIGEIVDSQVDTICKAQIMSIISSKIPEIVSNYYPGMQPCDKLNCKICLNLGYSCYFGNVSTSCVPDPRVLRGSSSPDEICIPFPIYKSFNEDQCFNCN